MLALDTPTKAAHDAYPGELQSLAQIFKHIGADHEKAEILGRCAREYVRENYDWDRNMSGLEALLRRPDGLNPC